jgi:hypothetical protein
MRLRLRGDRRGVRILVRSRVRARAAAAPHVEEHISSDFASIVDNTFLSLQIRQPLASRQVAVQWPAP